MLDILMTATTGQLFVDDVTCTAVYDVESQLHRVVVLFRLWICLKELLHLPEDVYWIFSRVGVVEFSPSSGEE